MGESLLAICVICIRSIYSIFLFFGPFIFESLTLTILLIVPISLNFVTCLTLLTTFTPRSNPASSSD